MHCPQKLMKCLLPFTVLASLLRVCGVPADGITMLAFLLFRAVMLSSLLLLAAGLTYVACVPALAGFLAVAGVPLFADVLTVAGLPAIVGVPGVLGVPAIVPCCYWRSH